MATERHFWINLADIGEKDKHFLLDSSVSPSELFGTSVETVVDKFREARARSAANKVLIPRLPGFTPKSLEALGHLRLRTTGWLRGEVWQLGLLAGAGRKRGET